VTAMAVVVVVVHAWCFLTQPIEKTKSQDNIWLWNMTTYMHD